MDFKTIRAAIIPIIVTLSILWVFNRPLSALGLFFYRFSGAYLNTSAQGLMETQKQAADLLTVRQKANRLEKANRELVLSNNLLHSQVALIADLNKALGFKNNSSYLTIPAKIIGRSPDSWHRQAIINKGSHHGIRVGQGVITEKGVVGQIQKVGMYSSIVQLVYNPDWRMGIKIDRLSQYGVLCGDFPAPPYLQFITIDSKVKKGDEIVTSGVCIDTNNCPYPENFPVGKVISVKKDPDEVDLVVKVKFHEDLSGVKEVFVLK